MVWLAAGKQNNDIDHPVLQNTRIRKYGILCIGAAGHLNVANSRRKTHILPEKPRARQTLSRRKRHIFVLLINLHERNIPTPLHDFRINHKSHQERRRIRLAMAMANLMAASRRLVP
jgi:hypothetical protein